MLSALMSAARTAFFSLSTAETIEIEEENDSRDARVTALLSQPEILRATTIIAGSMADTVAVVLCVLLVGDVFAFGHVVWLERLCAFLLPLLLVLLLGEMIPVSYACRHRLKTVRGTSSVVMACKRLFHIFVTPAARSFTVEPDDDTEPAGDASPSESEQVEMTDEKELMRGVLQFGDKTAQEVMTARVDLTDVDIHTDFHTLFKLFVSSGYSRIPVYDGTQDNIKGIIYVKDLLPYLSRGADFDWSRLVRPAYFIPETKTIDDLLNEFRRQKIHMAVVVDEFGGTSGIVTLEDVLEEIVGEISDEYDEEERLCIKLDDKQFIFQGKIPLEEFYEAIGAESSEFEIDDEIETLAGLVLAIRDDFPKPRDTFRYGRFTFLILKIDRYRIERVKVTIEEPAADEEGE